MGLRGGAGTSPRRVPEASEGMHLYLPAQWTGGREGVVDPSVVGMEDTTSGPWGTRDTKGLHLYFPHKGSRGVRGGPGVG